MDHGQWFRPYFALVGRVSSHLLEVVSSTTELVGIHVHTSMVLLIPSRSCFIFFGRYQLINHMDTSSCQVVVLIKTTRWIYDRGKPSTSQGYFYFTTTYECCVIKIDSRVTVFLVSKWMAEYGYDYVYEQILEFGYFFETEVVFDYIT